MKAVKIEQDQTVYGITIRTKNSNEMNPETAKIGKLWESFYVDIIPKLKENFNTFGVYSNYESDHNGEFDVSACSDQKVSESKEIVLKSGKYLVFTGTGEMPATVIETWGRIWSYFGNDDSVEERLFQTDYEIYKGNSEVEIYIGIK